MEIHPEQTTAWTALQHSPPEKTKMSLSLVSNPAFTALLMFLQHSKLNSSVRRTQQSTDQILWVSASDLKTNYYFKDKFYLNKLLTFMPNFGKYS